MYFSEETLKNLEVGYLTVSGKYENLLNAALKRKYNDVHAREHAWNGFSRRLKTLVRCIERVFNIFPPDREKLPSSEELSDANINLQAFIFNVFGCVDNLAWIWVFERNLTREDGSPIPREWVGLRGRNELVRNSFSPGLREFLDSLNEWFDLHESFRHAVAHRIPLYVPPYVVTKANEEAYGDLEDRKIEAINRGDLGAYDHLSAEQDALGIFRPIMTHSIADGARPVVFHSQMLADFNTIDALAWKLFEELDR